MWSLYQHYQGGQAGLLYLNLAVGHLPYKVHSKVQYTDWLQHSKKAYGTETEIKINRISDNELLLYF